MKKYIIVLFLFLISFCLFGCNGAISEDVKTEYFVTLFNDGLATSCIYDDNKSKKKYGYFNEDFEVVIDFIYDEAEGFNNGLAIVKHAVQFHGGNIAVTNRPNGGLRFEFTLKNMATR